MSAQRDSKRAQSYGAERHWCAGTLLDEKITFSEALEQTREIEATSQWRAHYERPITVGYNTGDRSWANAGSGTISYRVAGVTRSTVVHEMAHLLTPRDEGHGHAWRSAYVWTVRLAYGNDWADALAYAWGTSKLSYDMLPLDRATPVFPPEIFVAVVGEPLIKTNTATRGPIAL